MPVDLIGAQQNLLEAAKERLSFGQSPGWTRPCPFRLDFKAKQSGHQTFLAFDRQFHAESRQTFVHVALRLETLQGVHRHSQWRVDFDPATQSLIIHSITIRRGNLKIEQAHPEKFHIVNREAASDHVDTERVAALLPLEDLRPGDILEWSYSIHDLNPLLGEYAMALFAAPPGAPAGCLHFALIFNQSRPMKWKAFSSDFLPDETLDRDEMTWIWKRDNHPGSWPEENTPEWYVDYPWVQVSDCPDWESVSTALAAGWTDDSEDPTVTQLARKIAHENDNTHRQIERAIEMVQDEFRVLPTDPSALLRPPAAADVIARRRFGDSKDLAFLLCRLLQCLNVTARPVLVNNLWRHSVGSMLPAPVFDHALVEYQVRGETRWVDPTSKRQGGGTLNRVIRDYGVGLPVAPSARLANAPDTSAQTSLYEIKELILLDTSGAPSWLGVNVAARGSQAEELRREFEAEGAVAIARKRLQQCSERFGEARRIGELEYRDDRAANVFLLAEGFEISGFLVDDAKPGVYKFTVPNDFLAGALKTPDLETRRTPFAVPFPCNIVHIIEIHCLALPNGIVQSREVESPFVSFSRFRKTLSGDWTTKFTLSTLTDAVPAGQVEDYRRALREIRAEASWSLLVPMGHPRPHQRGDFGKLPKAWQQASQENAPVVALPFRPAPPPSVKRTAPPPAAKPTLSGERAREMLPTDNIESAVNSANGETAEVEVSEPEGGEATAASGTATVRRKRRKRHRRHRRLEGKPTFRAVMLWTLFAVGIALVFLYLCIRGGGPVVPNVDGPGQDAIPVNPNHG